MASHRQASKARTARSRTSATAATGNRRRDEQLRRAVLVLVRVGVEVGRRERSRRAPTPAAGSSPSTPTSISRPTIASSTRTHSSNTSAWSRASASPSASGTLTTPTDEPRLAGFTKHGNPSSAATRAASRLTIVTVARTRASSAGNPDRGRTPASSSPCPSRPRNQRLRTRRRERRPAQAGLAPCRPPRRGRGAAGSRRRTRSAQPLRPGPTARARVGRVPTTGPPASPSTSNAVGPPSDDDVSASRAFAGQQPSAVRGDRDRDHLVTLGIERAATATALVRDTSCSAERPPKSSSTRRRDTSAHLQDRSDAEPHEKQPDAPIDELSTTSRPRIWERYE